MSFTIYEHADFKGASRQYNLDAVTENELNSLRDSGLHDKMSSIRWDLKPGTCITFYEHGDGTGRSYSIELQGVHEDSDTSNNNFQDCASAWRLLKKRSVPYLFDRIRTTPILLEYSVSGQPIPSGYGRVFASNGHLQGVHRIDNKHVIVTGIALNEGAYFFIIKWNEGLQATDKGKVIKLVKIREQFPEIRQDHASGIQMVGNVVAIGLEFMEDEGQAGPKSYVVFYDLSNPAEPRATRPVISREKETASIIGMIQLTASVLLMVGGIDTKTLSFYESNGRDLSSSDCRFEKLKKSWNADEKNITGWVDNRWSMYQSLNLLRDTNGSIYILAFSYGSNDWLDLYQLNLDADTDKRLRKIAKRKITCDQGASFEFGSSMYYTGDSIRLLVTQKHVGFYFDAMGRITQDYRPGLRVYKNPILTYF